MTYKTLKDIYDEQRRPVQQVVEKEESIFDQLKSFVVTNTYYLLYLLTWLYRRPHVPSINSKPIFHAYDQITIQTKQGNVDKVRCLFDTGNSSGVHMTQYFYEKHYGRLKKEQKITTFGIGGISEAYQVSDQLTIVHPNNSTSSFPLLITLQPIPCDVLFGLLEIQELIRIGYVFNP